MDLPLKKALTMFLGTTVTYPPPGSDFPSIAAVVGSVDEHAVRYVERYQEHCYGKEEIDDMGWVIWYTSFLRKFKSVRKSFPQNLIMCRMVLISILALEKETPSTKTACRKVDPKYNPRRLPISSLART